MKRLIGFQKPPKDRVLAIEFLRQIIYGYNPVTDRLLRVLTIVEREES